MVGEECQEIEREADLPTFMLCEWKDRAKLGPQRKGGGGPFYSDGLFRRLHLCRSAAPNVTTASVQYIVLRVCAR